MPLAYPSAARRACQTGGAARAAAVSAAMKQAYLTNRAGAVRSRAVMAKISRLHHDFDLAQRATAALPVGLVLMFFLLFAAGVTIYDLGKWLAVW
jgi:hypothetical protein